MTDTNNPAPEATENTTPAAADATQVDPTQALAALQAKYERAQADLNKFRTRADEVTAAQKAAEEKALAEADATKRAELLQAKVAELEKASAEATAKAALAERKAALTGKVNDLDLALAVADKYAGEDGTVDVDALLAAHTSLKPTPAGPTPAASGSGTNPKAPSLTAGVNDLLKSNRQEDKARAAALLAQQMTKGN